MNYVSTITKDSAALPGVRFTVRELSEGARRRLRRATAASFAKLAEVDYQREDFHARLAERLDKPADQIKLVELTRDERREFDELNEAVDLIRDLDINPLYFEAGFVSVEGLTINGNASPDAKTLVEDGPAALVREITQAILAGSALSAGEEANLDSPSTSSAAVAGETNDTSAQPASAPAGTPAATASGWALKD
jgi:hypothetical protein